MTIIGLNWNQTILTENDWKIFDETNYCRHYWETLSLREKCPNPFEFGLNTSFSPNIRKYRPEMTPYLDTFHAVKRKPTETKTNEFIKNTGLLWMVKRIYHLIQTCHVWKSTKNYLLSKNQESIIKLHYSSQNTERRLDVKTSLLFLWHILIKFLNDIFLVRITNT